MCSRHAEPGRLEIGRLYAEWRIRIEVLEPNLSGEGMLFGIRQDCGAGVEFIGPWRNTFATKRFLPWAFAQKHPTWEKIMFKSALLAAGLALAFSAPVYAMDSMMKCDNASMMKMKSDMDATKGMKKEKKMAMEQMEMAKKSMMAKKMDDCKMHMDKAMMDMKMKKGG